MNEDEVKEAMNLVYEEIATVVSHFLEIMIISREVPKRKNLGFGFEGTVGVEPKEGVASVYKFVVNCQLEQESKQQLN